MRRALADAQLADGLTKDSAEPCDLLRGVIMTGRYQISEESLLLDLAKAERQNRKAAGGNVDARLIGAVLDEEVALRD